jgi:hypothetical protein
VIHFTIGINTAPDFQWLLNIDTVLPASLTMDKQQFLILAKSTRGRALCELISKATAEPGIFTFGELLSQPNVQEVGKNLHPEPKAV